MKYINKKLRIENINVQNIAQKYGTPIYCYSYKQLKKISLNLKKVLNLFLL